MTGLVASTELMVISSIFLSGRMSFASGFSMRINDSGGPVMLRRFMFGDARGKR